LSSCSALSNSSALANSPWYRYRLASGHSSASTGSLLSLGSILLPVLKASPFARIRPGALSAEVLPAAPAKDARIEKLLWDIRSVTTSEVDEMCGQIRHLEESGKLNSKQSRAMRREVQKRVGDLCSLASASELCGCAAAVRALQSRGFLELTEINEEAGSVGHELHQSRERLPQLAMEQRIGNLAQKHTDDLAALNACHLAMMDLTAVGLVRPKVQDGVLAALRRWTEKVPLATLRHRDVLHILLDLTSREPAFQMALELRFQLRASQSFTSSGQLPGFAQLMIDLEDNGVKLLSSTSSGSVIDPAGTGMLSSTAACSLQSSLQLAVFDMIKRLLRSSSSELLAQEFHGPVLRLCAFSKAVKLPLTPLFGYRVMEDAKKLAGLLGQFGDPKRVKVEANNWRTFAHNLANAGLLDSPEFSDLVQRKFVLNLTVGVLPERLAEAQRFQAAVINVLGLPGLPWEDFVADPASLSLSRPPTAQANGKQTRPPSAKQTRPPSAKQTRPPSAKQTRPPSAKLRRALSEAPESPKVEQGGADQDLSG